jgi:hypothetical protein
MDSNPFILGVDGMWYTQEVQYASLQVRQRRDLLPTRLAIAYLIPFADYQPDADCAAKG